LVDEADRGEAGQFNSAFLIARLPLYLFAAVQAALLPKLSHLVAAGRYDEFVVGMRRLFVVIIGITVLGVGGAFALGPFAISLLFGDEYEMSRVSITLLCGASCILMAAIAFAQGLIAVDRVRHVAFAWGVGLAAFIAVVATGEGSELRAEVGYVAGALVAAAMNGIFLVMHIRDVDPEDIDERTIPEIFVEP
jgi:O-antigen/teichoic acid export membrane protein